MTAFIGNIAENVYNNKYWVTKIKLDKEPERVYINLHLQKTQLKIREENKHKSGIYMIYNIKNGKYYIGSAISNRINTRFRNHCIHGTGAKLTNKAIHKYGLENFAFLILEYYPGFIKKENLTGAHIKLLELETSWIQKLNPEYNILNIAGSSLGYKHTKKTREKMKENYSQKRKDFCKNLNLNKSFSKEKKTFLSKLAKLHNQNLKLRERLSKLASKPIILYNLDGTIHSKYNSIRIMAKSFKCCNKTINKALKKGTVFKNIGIIKLDQ